MTTAGAGSTLTPSTSYGRRLREGRVAAALARLGRPLEVRTVAVVHSSNHVAIAVVDFHKRLGIERGRQSLDARRWVDAATETRDKMLETGAEGVDAAKRLGNETLDRARSVTGKLSSGDCRANAPSARG